MSVDPRWRENQEAAQATSGSANRLVPALAKLVRSGAWREFVHPMHGLQRYDTFSDYCFGFLQLEPKTVMNLLDESDAKAEAAEVRRMMLEAEPVLPDNGEIGNGRSRPDNVSPTRHGNSVSYTLRRLKRDRPDLAQKVIDGELSANAAAVKAGFRRPKATVYTDDPTAAVAALLRHFTREQLLEALRDT